VREKLDTDTSLVLRTFGHSRALLVASPAFLDAGGRPQQPQGLERLPLLSMFEHDGAQVLELHDAEGNRASVEMNARLICGDFALLHEAARRGQGVALLPEFVCAPSIARNELEVVLPGWNTPQGVMHFVYPSRRGQLPGVRALVEFLAERLPGAIERKHQQCCARAEEIKASAARP
jgi:DNA-binding transcriptional LysR family regulator